MADRSLGDLVPGPAASQPTRSTLHGRTIDLVPLTPAHADELFPLINTATPAQSALWDYMANGPYEDLDTFQAQITTMSTSTDPHFYAIIDKRRSTATSGKAIGYITLMSISPEHRRIEIGNVLFSAAIQKTTGATEAIYLLLGEAFEGLGYRRVEWKCNALNAPSRRAADRLGFVFEGVFRQHMVIKGRNRDTAWFSIVGEEWEGGVKGALEGWLAEGNFDGEGKQRRTLESFRD